MHQAHTRFSDEQVVFLLEKYSAGLMARVEVRKVLGVGKSRLFSLWREYRQDPQGSSVRCLRASYKRIAPEAEVAIEGSFCASKPSSRIPDCQSPATTIRPCGIDSESRASSSPGVPTP
jgi:hypothetical protein